MKKYAVSFSVICMLIFILSQSIYAQGKRILVVAPHEDDETLTCAGVMRNALLQNDDLKVLSVTDGATAGDQYTIDTRGTELTNALKTIGFTMDNKTDIMNRIFYLGYGDYGILSRAYKNKTNPNDVLNFTKTSYGMQNNDTTRSFTYNGSISVDSFHKSRFGTECQYTRNNILNDFVAVLQEYMPDEIYMPSPYESHPDHCSCGLFTNEAILKIKQTKNYSPAVYEYFIYPKEELIPTGFKLLGSYYSNGQ
ncbi:MAG TPA: PIG-L family deacetylase [Clostridia bacterium]